MAPDIYQTRERFERLASNEEAKQYDFVKARVDLGIKTTGFIGAVGLTIKACVGGGVVAMHESYKQCGMHVALVMNVIIGVLVGYCMYQLAASAQILYGRVKAPVMSFPDVAEASLALAPWERVRKYSKAFRYSVDVIVIIDLFGACCVYQVVVARTIKQLVDETVSDIDNSITPHIRIYILILTLPFMALCMIRGLSNLAWFTIVADIFIFIVAGATVYYGIKANNQSFSEFPAFKNFPGFLEFVGVCVFGMEGIGCTLAIENHMGRPKTMGMVTAVGMTVVVALTVLFGFFGYYGFGENSNSPITVNFPMTPFSNVLRVLLGIMIYFTYGLIFWTPFELVWYYLKTRYNENKYWFWERVYRAIFVILIALIALILPNVSNFIGLIGSACLSFMGFIFPAFIELIIIWEDPGLGVMKWRLVKNVFIIVFGTFMFFLGTYSNTRDLIKNVFMKGD